MKKLFSLIVFLIVFSGSVLADVAPDPGFKRITLNIVVEPSNDFADYRFFLKSGPEVIEIKPKKGERTVIKPLGGGTRYGGGTVLAVPKANLISLNETAVEGNQSDLHRAVHEGKISGTVELIQHGFSRDVRTAEASGSKDTIYRIEKDGDGKPRAILVSGGANESKKGDSGVSFGIVDLGKGPTIFGWAAIAGGIFMSLAIVSFGLLVFFRFGKGVR